MKSRCHQRYPFSGVGLTPTSRDWRPLRFKGVGSRGRLIGSHFAESLAPMASTRMWICRKWTSNICRKCVLSARVLPTTLKRTPRQTEHRARRKLSSGLESMTSSGFATFRSVPQSGPRGQTRRYSNSRTTQPAVVATFESGSLPVIHSTPPTCGKPFIEVSLWYGSSRRSSGKGCSSSR